ncbi:hypothetical protein GCM10011297_02910 [Bacterioplanes sanyensis]|uniref:hypothetical protein n=1 Tax=Bacterioplanes sanyensis TaxID=1249553 RepID=UPI00167B5EAC|nr:hypothetical protein [Bacterioplanes sanyensis]GGY33370.1 hypothetical protein GCM10011297_02910 [Bacterioplanes sanyensis]
MKKQLMAASMLALTVNSAQAMDIYTGVGGGVGLGLETYDIETRSGYGSLDVGDKDVGLKSFNQRILLGMVFPGNHRIEYSLNRIGVSYNDDALSGYEHDEFDSATYYGFEVDWLKWVGSSAMTPYVGGGVGLYGWNDNEHITVDGQDLELGWSLALAMGGTMDLSSSMKLDIGGKFRRFIWYDFEPYNDSDGMYARSSSLVIKPRTNLFTLDMNLLFGF